MAEAKNLLGQTFGYLTVVGQEESNAERRAMWRCRCICGKELLRAGKLLRQGNVRSCGCRASEMAAVSHIEKPHPYAATLDLSGLTMGNQLILRKTSLPGERARFLARCLLCGREKEVPRASLIKENGGTFGCGCGQKVDPNRPEKKCRKCGITKSREHFYKNNASPDNLYYICVECALLVSRRGKFLYQYGLSVEEYEEMFRLQNGACAVCSSAPRQGQDLPVDHNHLTGKVRGLLCHSCNRAYGFLKENEDIIEALLAYHRVHQEKNGVGKTSK